jgi:hypothetical protein
MDFAGKAVLTTNIKRLRQTGMPRDARHEEEECTT